MFRAHSTPDPDRIPPRPDPGQLSAWLGVPIATLQAPQGQISGVGQFSLGGSGAYRPAGGPPGNQAVTARIGYLLADGTAVDVLTRRDPEGTASVLEDMWIAVLNFQAAMAGDAGTGSPHAALPVDPPDPAGARDLTLAGVTVNWTEIVHPDPASGQRIAVCGGRAGTSVITVVGMADSLAGLALDFTAEARGPGSASRTGT